ncbi:hypothetical protein HPCU_07085 [Helicobacter pylori Cuz20]|uniref:Uncharacterized protein n=1 Tax=Helicobacter pylori (strain Cuz20) TaxID=765964 RepID=A0AB32X941_HELPC|nr:hypothetical protein HPCU_05200 [Helicobacter pylori Cuz20]ADO04559.1 hypothetical protein HPCU_07085 [Helicobacter pylori Cuz20]
MIKNPYQRHRELLELFSKGRLSQFKGIKKEIFLLHLKECEFRYNKGKLVSNSVKIDQKKFYRIGFYFVFKLVFLKSLKTLNETINP